MEATLSTKGQITLPKPIRESLHLKTGDKIIFTEIEGIGFVMKPRTTDVKSLKGLVSYTQKPISIDDMDNAIQSLIIEN